MKTWNDELIQSPFRTFRVKQLFKEHYFKNGPDLSEEYPVLSLSYGNLRLRKLDNSGLLPESFRDYNKIEFGSIVFRLTDLQNDKTSIRVAAGDRKGLVSPAYVVIVPKFEANYRYFSYFFKAYDGTKQIYELGSGVRQSGSWFELKNNLVLNPELSIQTAIANYLDHETARIDAEIKKEERRIELLEEYLQAVIFETVTKGLDKNVEMKDSGIDWIGRVPKGWEVKRLKNISNIQKGSEFDNEWADETGNFPYINGGMNPSHFSNKFNTPANFIAVSEGGASAGFVQFVTTKFWAGQHCYKVKPTYGVLNEYLYYVLKGFEHLFMSEKTGSAMPNLQKTRFLNHFVVYCPDVIVQESIKDYLKLNAEKIIIKRQSAIKKIGLLKELKQATIYEAVTGKTEIPAQFYTKE